MVDLPLHGRVDEIQRRLARVEEAVEALAAAAGIAVPAVEAGFDAEVLAAVRDGRRMQAIKLATERLGLSLQEATEYIGRAEGSR